MEKLKLEYEQLTRCLKGLSNSIHHLKKSQSTDVFSDFMSRNDFQEIFCDSVIKRLSLSSRLFWKYLKRYLTEQLKQTVEFNAPRPVIRAAVKAKMVSEPDGEMLLKMIDDRNMSSHIYKEEIADQIGSRAEQYHALMQTYIQKLTPTDEPSGNS